PNVARAGAWPTWPARASPSRSGWQQRGNERARSHLVTARCVVTEAESTAQPAEAEGSSIGSAHPARWPSRLTLCPYGTELTIADFVGTLRTKLASGLVVFSLSLKCYVRALAPYARETSGGVGTLSALAAPSRRTPEAAAPPRRSPHRGRAHMDRPPVSGPCHDIDLRIVFVIEGGEQRKSPQVAGKDGYAISTAPRPIFEDVP